MRYNSAISPYLKFRLVGSLRRVLWKVERKEKYMRKIKKKILTDSSEKPVAVQIEYTDWLEIERSLNLQGEDPQNTDLSNYQGIITLTEEPLGYQSRIRQEWS